jgi:hypothetical protein
MTKQLILRETKWHVNYQDGRADDAEFDTEQEAKEYWKKHYKKRGQPVDSHVTFSVSDKPFP